MTLPHKILYDEDNIRKGAYDPKATATTSTRTTTKPTARILPLFPNQGSHTSRAQVLSSKFSDDIAEANIKTKISQFEHLAKASGGEIPPIIQRQVLQAKVVTRPPHSPGPLYFSDELKFMDGANVNNGFSQQQCVSTAAKPVDKLDSLERLRLEEILTICSEYEKQAQNERNAGFSTVTRMSPNRIKTNGSLPRDRRNPQSSAGSASPHDPDCNVSTYSLDSSLTTTCSSWCPAEIVSPTYAQEFEFPNSQVRHPNEHRNRIKTTITPSICAQKAVLQPLSPQPTHSTANFNVNYFKYSTLPKDAKLAQLNITASVDESTLADVEKWLRQLKEQERIMTEQKTKLAENESCLEELIRQYEMEKSLISGEYKSKLDELRTLELRHQQLCVCVQNIELTMSDTQLNQMQDQAECAQKLDEAQARVVQLEVELPQLKPDTLAHSATLDEYLLAQEKLDIQRKTFEDLEFHHLEKEADLLASREELQRDINEIALQIDELKLVLKDLKMQLDKGSESHNSEHNQLEQQRIDLQIQIETTRSRLKQVMTDLKFTNSDICYDEDDNDENTDDDEGDDDCSSVCTSKNNYFDENSVLFGLSSMTQSVNEKLFHQPVGEILSKKTPSQGDIDRICKVTANSPMSLGANDSVGRKTMESLMEIERNRHLHLVERGSQVIENERRRVSLLKEKAHQDGLSEFASRKPILLQQEASTLESDVFSKSTNNHVDHESDGNNTRNDSDNNSIMHLEMEPMPSPSPPAVISIKRPTSRKEAAKQRPLTRYLPIRDTEFDLRQHIVSAGHQVILCPFVEIDATSCRGYLTKKWSKFNRWSRRFFVFDRQKRVLIYYDSQSEKKVKGCSYFQDIEDVYLDHLNSVHSAQPHLTFVMKTRERQYHLMAPSPEAMRIWIDVIFTGAEGNDYNTTF